MKPVLAISVAPGMALDNEYLGDILNRALDREFGAELVSVRLLTEPDELRAYEAGEMVLYRKPARRVGNTIVYRKDGEERRLEQLTAFSE